MNFYNYILKRINTIHNTNISDLNRLVNVVMREDFPVTFFTNYTYWNSMFAGCVTGLSSNFHLWPYLDCTDEVLDSTSFTAIESFKKQKSHIVSGYILAAAEDEYCEKQYEDRVTHKHLAWLFIRGIFDFFKQDVKLNISDFTKAINKATLDGYGINAGLNNLNFFNLIESFGFHLASEKLASLEFTILHNHLKENYHDLYVHLTKFTFDGELYGIDWLRNHGELEKEHFEQSMLGLHEICNSIDNANIGERACVSILSGMEKFTSLQYDFFTHHSLVRCR